MVPCRSMGEPDLAGYDDAEDTFREIDTDSDEHLRQTAYHAAATRRGTDQETEELKGAWIDLTQFLQGRGSIVGRIRGALGSAAQNLMELDPRIERAVYTVAEEANGAVQWTADITSKATTALVSVLASPFPQDVPVVPPPVLPDPGPVPPGMRSLAQFALDTSHVIGWLTGPNSGRVLWSIGKTCDAAIEWLYQGIQQRFPDFASPDALPWLGRDRLMLRGVAETEASFRRRLKNWLVAIRVWGTPLAVLMNIQAYFATNATPTNTGPLCRIVQHHPHPSGTPLALWATLSNDGELTFHTASPGNWDWDFEDPLRPASLDTTDPRFWVIIYQDPDSGLFALDQSSPIQVYDFAEDTSFGNPDKGVDLAGFAEFWKSGHAWCAGVIIAYSEALFEPEGSGSGYPDGTWHLYGDPDNDYAPNRAQPARYLEMRNHNGPIVGL